MLTGTALDITPFGVVLKSISVLYWLFVISVLVLVVIRVKGRFLQVLSAIAVLAILVGPVAWDVLKKREKLLAWKARLNTAMKHFDMRCKSAGESIYRTVEGVEGVVWMKWRPESPNFGEQFTFDDPYGRDCGGEECFRGLLRVTKGAALNPEAAQHHTHGYRFIETTDPADGKQYRYIGVIKPGPSWTPEKIEEHKRQTGQDMPASSNRFSFERTPIDRYTARYGITWEDISTREDREMWIAGGVLKVIDLKTSEVIAQRIGYMIDKGQGSTAGFRTPWSFAQNTVCPSHSKGSPLSYLERTKPFVSKVLRPISQGE